MVARWCPMQFGGARPISNVAQFPISHRMIEDFLVVLNLLLQPLNLASLVLVAAIVGGLGSVVGLKQDIN